MGDRRMVEIKTRDGSLYVYSHSEGSRLPEIVQRAIKVAEPRWNDESYAVRILVDQITKTCRDSEYGYGLMLKPNAEDSYNADTPSIIVDLTSRIVKYIDKNHKEQRQFNQL